MTKEQIKVVISDIDGTLINDNDELPNNFKEMVDKLHKRDIIFVAASGRGAVSIKNKLEYDSDNLYIISDNGGITMKGDKLIHAASFERDDYETLIDHFRSFDGNSIGVATTEKLYLEIGSDHVDSSLFNEFFYGSEIVDDIKTVTGDIVGITVHNQYHADENFKSETTQALLKDHTLVQSGIYWIDAIPNNTNKGTAVKRLLESLNLTTDNAIAFGDYNNDIEMLQTVKRGFAMQDATEDVKAIADEVIGSNNDNSVIKKIYELLDI